MKNVIFIISVLAWLSAANAGENKLVGKWVNKNLEKTLDYIEILPNNTCTYLIAPSNNAKKCKIIAKDKIEIDGVLVPFSLFSRSTKSFILVSFPKKGKQSYIKYADFMNRNAYYMFEMFIKKNDIENIKISMAKLAKTNAILLQPERYCKILYEHTYLKKNIQFGKWVSKNGCKEKGQVGYVQKLIRKIPDAENLKKLDFLFKNDILTIDMNSTSAFFLLQVPVSTANIPAINYVLSLKPNIYAKSRGADIYGSIPHKTAVKKTDSPNRKEQIIKENRQSDQIRVLLDNYKKRYAPKTRSNSDKNKSSNSQQNDRMSKAKGSKRLDFHTDPVKINGGCNSVRQVSTNGLKNHAIEGKAKQVSTGAWSGIEAKAELAIDGNTDGAFNHKSVAHTKNINQAWWAVDLGANKNIKKIVIWNRTDKNSDAQLKEFSVYVINHAGHIVFQQGYCENPKFPKPALLIDLPNNTHGQYVKIMLNKRGFLQLAEVQVFGK